MKFLCLHGMGTNSEIFRSQLAALVPELEDNGHEFVFVDGDIECPTSEEISSCYPGPFLCYYPLPTHELVSAAQEFIFEVIEEEGPFDGVIGFSQGAALAASLMLLHAKENTVEPLFQMAIFAGASLPFNIEDRNGLEHWVAARSDISGTKCEYSISEMSAGFPNTRWDLEAPPELLGRYHPQRNPTSRITQPTIHIIGKEDEYASQGHTMTKLCTGNVTVLEHPGGHRIPRDLPTIKKASATIDKVITQVNFRS